MSWRYPSDPACANRAFSTACKRAWLVNALSRRGDVCREARFQYEGKDPDAQCSGKPVVTVQALRKWSISIHLLFRAFHSDADRRIGLAQLGFSSARSFSFSSMMAGKSASTHRTFSGRARRYGRVSKPDAKHRTTSHPWPIDLSTRSSIFFVRTMTGHPSILEARAMARPRSPASRAAYGSRNRASGRTDLSARYVATHRARIGQVRD
jgi:hypothetical protein